MATPLTQLLVPLVTVADQPHPADDPSRHVPIDPEKLPYLRKLINAILEGRVVVSGYNLALLALLFLLSLHHFFVAGRDRRRWKERIEAVVSPSREDKNNAVTYDTIKPCPIVRCEESRFSSSSSTPPNGATTPSFPSRRILDADLERLPLLDCKPRRTPSPAFVRSIAGWLAYQPRPLPVVNRLLPCNQTSLVVAVFVGLNVFFHLYRLPLAADYFFAFADRAGFVFIVNLPLLYLLAAKNQPLKLLTGCSYEALNIFHRRVGELMCFEASLHLVGMLIWRLFLSPDWLRRNTFREYLLERLILLGFAAYLPYQILFFTSLGSFRQRWYELFLATHVFMQVVALVCLWFHFFTSRPYVLASLTIFLVDRLVYRLGLKSVNTVAELTILDDGETLLLSANWDVLHPPKSASLLPRKRDIRSGWRPTDHVFLTVPSLGRTHSLQAHPFTIASAAPPISSWAHQDSPSSTEPRPTHAWFSLLIRAHNGFTADLLRYARLHSSVPVRLDGPYGSPHALELLRASDSAVLVAGGSGIAVTYPLVAALLLSDPPERPRKRIHMLWVIHSRPHRGWVPAERLQELVDAGLDLITSEPTAEAGRPDVEGIVSEWLEDGKVEGAQVGVVVSGPDGMNRTVANTCSEAIREGANVRIAVEKFGW